MEADDDSFVHLERAWRWTCPVCKGTNYADSELLPKDEADELIRAENGLDEWEPIPEELQGEFTLAPSFVSCAKCAKQFQSVEADYEGEDGEEDDEDEGGGSAEIPGIVNPFP